MSDACYVYGLVRADLSVPPDLTGLDGAPVELLTQEGLGALVSAAPTERPLGTRDDLFAHEQVVDTVAAVATVLPMRFGSVVERSAVMDELLAPHRDELVGSLDELDGHVQYTVKGRFQQDVVLREVILEDPEIARLRERVQGVPEEASYQDRLRLGELVVGALEDRGQREGRRMHEALSGLAAASVARPSGDPEQLLDSAFLVPRDRVEEFEQAVDRLGSETAGSVRFRLIGPLAPYDFVSAER
jgi:hypothetical protein